MPYFNNQPRKSHRCSPHSTIVLSFLHVNFLEVSVLMCYGGGQLRRSGRGAIPGCHCSGLRLRWEAAEVVPLRCHCSVLWSEGGSHLSRVPLQGAIIVCCGVGKVTTNFGGADVDAMAGYHCSVPMKCAVVGGEGWRATLGEWTWCHY